MKSEFLIRVESPALEGIVCDVHTFEGTEGLNQLPVFRVELWTEQVGAAHAQRDAVLTEPFSILFVHDGVEVRRFRGIVADSEARIVPGGRALALDLTIVPRVWALSQNRATHYFMEQTYSQVIAHKLTAAGFVQGEDFIFALTEQYHPRDLITQHDESDFAFISRLAEHLGIAFWFEERGDREVLVFSDAQATFPRIARNEPVVHGHTNLDRAVLELSRRKRRVPGRGIVHDYNYRAPRLDLAANDSIKKDGALGDWVEYGVHTRTPDESAKISKIRSEELGMEHYVLHGKTTEPTMRAGATFQLIDELGDDEELLLLKVTHRLEQNRGTSGGSSVVNEFEAIPTSVRYRPRRVTPKPRIPGLVHAVIDGAIKGPYAEIDPWGRYRVRFGTDRSGKTNLEASRPVRMLQQNAGENYGTHFPLRPGTEVFISHVDGDPDRPLILGAVPNPIKPSPVQAENYTENVIRTEGRNEIVMEDQHTRRRVRVHTPNHQTTLQLGAWQEPEEGALLRTNAHISLAAAQSIDNVMRRGTNVMAQHTTLVGENAVVMVGLPALRASSTAIRSFAELQERAATVANQIRDLGKLQPLPWDQVLADEKNPGTTESAGTGPAPQGTYSGLGSGFSMNAHDAAIDASRAMAERADKYAADSGARTHGQTLCRVDDPRLVLGSLSNATLFAHDTLLAHADRVATVSSDDTSRVVAKYKIDIQSPEQVEIAGGRSVHVTSTSFAEVAGQQLSLLAVENPTKVVEALPPDVSLALLAEKELKLKSSTAAIKACAEKDIVIHSHKANIRIVAKETVAAEADEIQASANRIAAKAGDVTVDGDLDVSSNKITIEAQSDITIIAPTITLAGTLIVVGDLDVTGSINGR